MTRPRVTWLVIALATATFAACGDKEAEEAESEETVGEEVEEAAEDTGEAIEEGAEDTAEAVDEAEDEVDNEEDDP